MSGGSPHPGGTTLYHCPLCSWTHAVPPSWTQTPVAEFPEGTCVFSSPAELIRAVVGQTEDILAAHLRTHPLAEWVREVVHLQEIVAAYRKVYDDGDEMDETIRHLAACGKCDPVGYDHTLCDGYSAAVSADAKRLREQATGPEGR